MARVGTTNGGLGTWLDGENPGAGDQVSDNNGLNGNWIKLDKLFIEHATDGTHRDDKINGNSLKSSVADGTTLETSAATGAKTIRVKDGGISAAKLASDAVTTAKVLDANITAAKLASDAVTTAKILDLNVTLAKLAADSVNSSKITHDNTRTKVYLTFGVADYTSAYATVNGFQTSASVGLVLNRAGSVTGIVQCENDGNVTTLTFAYGAKTFAASDKLTFAGSGGDVHLRKNGSIVTGTTFTGTGASCAMVLEIELDD